MADINWDDLLMQEPVLEFFEQDDLRSYTCKLCNAIIRFDSVKLEILTEHLLQKHEEEITHVATRYQINTWYRKHFKIQIMCQIESCRRLLNLFCEEEDLTIHMIDDHNIEEYSDQQLILSLQEKKEKRLQWGDPDNLIWQFFKPLVKEEKAICNICFRVVEHKHLSRYERHMKTYHEEEVKELIKKVEEKVQSQIDTLAESFKFYPNELLVICAAENCKARINYFSGVPEFEKHLLLHGIPKSTKRSSNRNVDSPKPGSSQQ